MVDPKHFVE